MKEPNFPLKSNVKIQQEATKEMENNSHANYNAPSANWMHTTWLLIALNLSHQYPINLQNEADHLPSNIPKNGNHFIQKQLFNSIPD